MTCKYRIEKHGMSDGVQWGASSVQQEVSKQTNKEMFRCGCNAARSKQPGARGSNPQSERENYAQKVETPIDLILD